MEEFIDTGFTAIIIAARTELFDKEILGRKMDRDFMAHLDKLSKTKEITLCGEAGEYHTIVIDGPIFKKRLEIVKTDKVQRNEHIFLDILKTEIKDK